MAMVDAGKNMVGIIPDDVNGGNWIAFSPGTRTCMTVSLAESIVCAFTNRYAGCGANAELKLVAMRKPNTTYRNFPACQIRG